MTDIQGQEGNPAQIVVVSPVSKESSVTLSAEQLLAALDAQIRFVTESQRNEGLTRWAIWGALAAIVWVATGLLQNNELILSQAALVACGFFVVWVLFEEIIYLLAPNSSIEIGPTRFQLATDIINTFRPEVVASGLRHLLVLVALIYFQFPGQWLLWSYAILAILWSVTFFVLGMTGFAFPTRFNLPAVLTARTLTHVLFLIVTGLQVGALIRSSWSSYTMVDVRLALVLNAGFYLLIRLATASSSEHLFSRLTQLRQHIAFGRLSIDEANQKAEFLLSGLKPGDVLHPLMENIRKQIGELTPFQESYGKLINEASIRIATLKKNRSSEIRKNKFSRMFYVSSTNSNHRRKTSLAE